MSKEKGTTAPDILRELELHAAEEHAIKIAASARTYRSRLREKWAQHETAAARAWACSTNGPAAVESAVPVGVGIDHYASVAFRTDQAELAARSELVETLADHPAAHSS